MLKISWHFATAYSCMPKAPTRSKPTVGMKGPPSAMLAKCKQWGSRAVAWLCNCSSLIRIAAVASLRASRLLMPLIATKSTVSQGKLPKTLKMSRLREQVRVSLGCLWHELGWRTSVNTKHTSLFKHSFSYTDSCKSIRGSKVSLLLYLEIAFSAMNVRVLCNLQLINLNYFCEVERPRGHGSLHPSLEIQSPLE